LILIDSSAWIEFLRRTGSPANRRVADLLRREIATTDPVRMELLAGARDESHLSDLRRLLARATLLPTESGDYERAAALYRTCRRRGETVRRLIDCLIAAVAIRNEIAVLHADGDFDVLARHTELQTDPT
jgi:predicted nucleic acid-binding protein